MSRLGRRTPLDLLGVELGQVVWVYARHHWREARVVTKAFSRVTVAYFVNHGGRLVRQDVPLRNLSIDKPIAHYATVLNVAAPRAEFIAEKGGCPAKGSVMGKPGPAFGQT